MKLWEPNVGGLNEGWLRMERTVHRLEAYALWSLNERCRLKLRAKTVVPSVFRPKFRYYLHKTFFLALARAMQYCFSRVSIRPYKVLISRRLKGRSLSFLIITRGLSYSRAVFFYALFQTGFKFPESEFNFWELSSIARIWVHLRDFMCKKRERDSSNQKQVFGR